LTAGGAEGGGEGTAAGEAAAAGKGEGEALGLADGLPPGFVTGDPAEESGAADATASGVAFVKAIEAAGSTDTDKVRDAIAKLSFTSFYGVIKFDERGINVTKPMAVEQWQNARRVTVWPSDVAEAKALWPLTSWSAR